MGQFFNKLRHPDVIYPRWSTHVSRVSSRCVDVVTLRDQMAMVTVARFSYWFFTAMAGNKEGKKNQSSSTYFCFYASPIMALGGARYFVQRNTLLSLILPENSAPSTEASPGKEQKNNGFRLSQSVTISGSLKPLPWIFIALELSVKKNGTTSMPFY